MTELVENVQSLYGEVPARLAVIVVVWFLPAASTGW